MIVAPEASEIQVNTPTPSATDLIENVVHSKVGEDFCDASRGQGIRDDEISNRSANQQDENLENLIESCQPRVGPCMSQNRDVFIIELNGKIFRALIDTRSKITCISNEIFVKFSDDFKDCSKFPVVGLKAINFSGNKSIAIKTQSFVNCKIGNTELNISVMVVLKLVRDFIIGINALSKFRINIDTWDESLTVGISGEGVLCNDRRKVDLTGSEILPELPVYESLINITDVDIDNKLINIEGVTVKTKENLWRLILECRDIFDDRPGHFNNFGYKFTVLNDRTFFTKPYPIPFQHREADDKEINRMLALGIIEPSYTPYINPLVNVVKKDMSVRICLDARELNKRLQEDHDGPEPINVVFKRFCEGGVLSSIDLTASFWQVPLAKESRKYTGFI